MNIKNKYILYIKIINLKVMLWSQGTTLRQQIKLQKQLIQEAALHFLEQAYAIELPTPYQSSMWWPWVKNYHGEFAVGDFNYDNYSRWVWVDQDLKNEMTGK